VNRASAPFALIATLAMVLALTGLSSCAGYTSSAKTTPSDPGAGILSPSATSLAFGSIAVGNTATQSLTVTNTGLGSVTISAATLTGVGFTVVGGNPSGTIAVGQSSTIQVQFAPTSAGAITGSLTVVSDSSNSPLAIEITGTGTQTGLTIAPSALTFGNVVVGQSGTQSVKLMNSGTSNLTINLATVAGTGFGISGLSLPTTLTAGQSLSFNAQFAPTAAGAETGSVTFTDNAPGSPQVVSMVGTGVTTSSTLVASPGSVAFGNVATGNNGEQSITLTNNGNASATITAVSATGTGFSATGLATPLTLAVNQSTTFTAQFAPTTAGVAAGSILITSTASNPTVSIALSGTGVQGNLTANPASINFGSMLVGASGSVSVTLTNSGTASVAISSGSASGTGFSITGLTPSTLNAGQSTTFTAKFSPTVAGSATGGISIVSNAPSSPLSIALSGSGTATQPQLTISPASVAFGNVSVGSSGTQTVTLTNAGTGTMTVTSATPSGTGFSMSGAGMPMTINAGSSASFSAIFAPTAAGAATGSISIVSNAPGSPAAIALSGTGMQGQVAASPSSVNFGSIAVGSNGTQSITVTNSGTASVTISSATVSGAGLSISGLSTPLTLGAGLSTTFSAKFAPTSAGSANGSISIVSNAPNSPTTIALSGTGTATQPQLTISPASVAFGNVSVGSSGTQTVTLTNAGTGTLTVTSATPSGTGFSMSGASMPMTINAGSSASFSAVYTPTTSGAATGSISIVSNAPNSPTTITLSGTGTQAQLAASPTSTAFGNVATGTSNSQTITLTNGGTATVTISAVTVTGAGFSTTGITTPLALGAGLSTTFSAKFAPTSAGSATGGISIVSNAPNSPTAITLSGTGTQPQLSATPTSAAFGNVTTGTSNSQTITLTNSGSATVTISSVTVAGAGFSTSGIATPANIAAGQSTTFNAVFGPSSAGSVTGTVTLVSNAPTSPLTITLSGTGVAATRVLGLSSSTLSFGNVNVGSTGSMTSTVTNNGNSNVTISGVNVSGTGFNGSGITSGETLTPNQSVTVTAQFAPGAAGAVSGSVSITSNATNSPTAIALSGTGVAATPHSVSLSWTASSSPVSGYNVYRGTTSNGPYPTKLNPSLVTSVDFTDSTVADGTTYYYVVTSVNSSNVESTDSNQATAVIP
jgi:Abnormal spindle-like microcephaly-assoc'd, ASPM-SPD-2-Hydin